MTSNVNDLTERLRRRLESERQAIEELTASELERLGANSRRVARNVLHTIEPDTAVATGRMRALLLKAWLRPLVVGLSLWLGICGGSWATMQWLSARIQARIETAAALDLDIGEARQTLARLEAKDLLRAVVRQALQAMVSEGGGRTRGRLGADGGVLRLPRGSLEASTHDER